MAIPLDPFFILTEFCNPGLAAAFPEHLGWRWDAAW